MITERMRIIKEEARNIEKALTDMEQNVSWVLGNIHDARKGLTTLNEALDSLIIEESV